VQHSVDGEKVDGGRKVVLWWIMKVRSLGLFCPAKKMVITELKVTRPSVFGSKEFDLEWLTLKKLDGTIIEEERMPQGDKFLATLTREEDPGKFMFYYG
jgi:hypothetical protein